VVVVVLAFFLARPPSDHDHDTITGSIADPAGAVVPNAAVEIRNVKVGAVYQAGRRSRHSPTTATRKLTLDYGLRSNSRLICAMATVITAFSRLRHPIL
jgi:hypothetical protein